MPKVMNHSDVFSGDVSTEAQSYWLGFFCADGGLHLSRRGYTAMRLSFWSAKSIYLMLSLRIVALLGTKASIVETTHG